MSVESLLLCISRYTYSAHSAHSAEKKGSEKKIKNIFSKIVGKNHIEKTLYIYNYNFQFLNDLYNRYSSSLNGGYLHNIVLVNLRKNNFKKIFRPLKFCGICRIYGICGIDRTLFYPVEGLIL